MTFPVIIHKSEYGYCASQGDTYDEAVENIKSAIREYLDAVETVEKAEPAEV